MFQTFQREILIKFQHVSSDKVIAVSNCSGVNFIPQYTDMEPDLLGRRPANYRRSSGIGKNYCNFQNAALS